MEYAVELGTGEITAFGTLSDNLRLS